VALINQVTAYCDTHGCAQAEVDAIAWSGGEYIETKTEAMKYLKKHGWQRIDGELLCPDCVACTSEIDKK